MTRETILQIWEAEGVRPAGNTITVREEHEATCFIETKGELMTVARVTKFDLHDTFIKLVTAKDERYLFVYEDVIGFKLSGTAAPKDRAAGFGR